MRRITMLFALLAVSALLGAACGVRSKFYAPGVGNVEEVATKGPQETLTLIAVKHG